MTGLIAVSLFAGIGGFDLALQRCGVDVVAAVEIDDAARGVLADRFPTTRLFTDVREVTGDDLRAAGFVPHRGIITAGFPCQDLSVAGRRGGLGEGTRSGLFWEIARLVADLRPAWIILENVPGLLSATCPCPGTGEHQVRVVKRTSDYVEGDNVDLGEVRYRPCSQPHQVSEGYCAGGCFPAHGGAMGLVLGALGDLGYGFAYRVLDAQSFGVPQRRRRVFIVGRAGGDARGPVEVLLEPEGRAGDSAAGGESGPVVAALTANGVGGGGGPDDNAAQAGHLIASAITAREGKGPNSDARDGNLVVDTLRSHPRPGSNSNGALAPVAFDTAQITSAENRSNPKPGDPAPTLSATGYPHVAHTLTAGSATGAGVRAPGRRREDDENLVAHPLRSFPGGVGQGHNTNYVTHTLTGEGADASEDGTGRGTPRVPCVPPVSLAVAGEISTGVDIAQTVRSANGQPGTVAAGAAVRRLTPLECERLQGFPDRWTAMSNGKTQADAARYRQCGNAVAVPVVRWVLERVRRVAERELSGPLKDPEAAA
jgi:site-specific DNA-cytosine methylase